MTKGKNMVGGWEMKWGFLLFPKHSSNCDGKGGSRVYILSLINIRELVTAAGP